MSVKPTFQATIWSSTLQIVWLQDKRITWGSLRTHLPIWHWRKEFNILHNYLVKQWAEVTELLITCNAVAKETNTSPSSKEYLGVGPPLSFTLWMSVLTKCPLKPGAITGDLKQAFLQIRIFKDEREITRFHWTEDRETL